MVDVKPHNARCIDVHVSMENTPKWRATFVYGEPRRELRHEFFDFLSFLRAQWTGPWIVCGNFNEVMSRDEYFGPGVHTDHQIGLFRNCLEICKLDMGFTRPKMTWSNRQANGDLVCVRLDRAVCKRGFLTTF
jgi:hypothetical protein